MKSIKVLLLDPLPEGSRNEFTTNNYEITENFDQLSETQLINCIHEFNLVCLSRSHETQIFTEEVLRSAHRLLAIGVFGTLSNQIDLPVAQLMGIPVFTAPYQHQQSVCELIISFIILLSRQIGDKSREIHQNTWNKTSVNCNEVRGKTLGIIGYGNTGSQLGVLAEALSIKVVFYDLLSIMPLGQAKPCSLNDLLQQSDFVSINVSKDPSNKHLLSTKQLSQMKPTAFLINTSFGEAVSLCS